MTSIRATTTLPVTALCVFLATGCGRSIGPDVPLSQVAKTETSLKFEITLPEGASHEALQGRLLILVSAAATGEPRFQVNDGPGSAQVFGVDVENWMPGSKHTVDGTGVRLSRARPRYYARG